MTFLRSCFLLVFLASSAFAGNWITYERCTFERDKYYDGDSFQVRAQSPTTGKATTYVFRLYGADCAETDTRYPERVAAQAADFKLPPSEMAHWGEKARAFSAKFLSHPFTVITRKEDARGDSQKHRYFAIILGSDGRDLAKSLIEAGLARAYGVWPDNTAPKVADAARYRSELERTEAAAKTARAGIWNPGGEPPADIFKSPLPFSDKP